jgi:hypothetical protein
MAGTNPYKACTFMADERDVRENAENLPITAELANIGR